MTEVISVKFKNRGKVYFFDPHGIAVRTGEKVVVETSRGLELAECVQGSHAVPDETVVQPLRSLARIATKDDLRIEEINRRREKEAFAICKQKIVEHGLDMKLVDVECSFEGNKTMFFFTSDGRVDFRELVKDLASVFRTRIELRQIGVRDKAKMVGGLGICGRPFCCREFLDDFQPVSIKMAKTQNLSLNPTKISGTCGRLMCCLNYEQAAYEDLIKNSPKAESFVDTPDGRGTVTDVNLLCQCVKVRLEQQPDTIVCHKNCDICVLRNGKAKKNDTPIPDDLAPISGDPKRRSKKNDAPQFTTYLDPVVMKQNAEVLEEARTNAPEIEEVEEAAKRRRRRGGRGRNKSKAEAKPAEAKPAKPAEPRPAKPEGKPVKAAEGAKSGVRRRYHRRRRGNGGPKTEA